MSQYHYKGYYFKALFDEPALMSGCNLPDPNCSKGYLFTDCEFHPRLWECMRQVYTTSIFENCYLGPR